MDRKAFYDGVRSKLFGTLSATQVKGIEAVLNEWDKGGYTDERWLAYALATAHHETGARFAPVVENLNYSAKRLTEVWKTRFPTLASATPYANNPQKLANKVYGGRNGNVGPDDGWRYRGRGLVQITFKDNYAKYGLADNPDKASEVGTAAFILIDGMVNGRFTGLALRHFFDHDTDDALGARKIINPDANGDEVATHYRKYLDALRKAGA